MGAGSVAGGGTTLGLHRGFLAAGGDDAAGGSSDGSILGTGGAVVNGHREKGGGSWLGAEAVSARRSIGRAAVPDDDAAP